MKKKSVGRPRQGRQSKQVVSIRLEPSHKTALKKKYGSIQKAVESLLNSIKK